LLDEFTAGDLYAGKFARKGIGGNGGRSAKGSRELLNYAVKVFSFD